MINEMWFTIYLNDLLHQGMRSPKNTVNSSFGLAEPSSSANPTFISFHSGEFRNAFIPRVPPTSSSAKQYKFLSIHIFKELFNHFTHQA